MSIKNFLLFVMDNGIVVSGIFERKGTVIMDKKRILIAETCVELAEALCQALEADYDLHLCHDGLAAQQILEAVQTDVLVLDLALPEVDGLSLLKMVGQLSHRPRILVMSSYIDNPMELVLTNLNVDVIAVKPCKVEFLAEQIRELLPVEMSFIHLHSRTSIGSMLLELNLPPHRCGYRHLEEAIELYLQHPTQTLTKFIYPQIANRYDSNSPAVERAIRKMIRDSYLKRDDQVWSKYFSVSREGIVPLPTNAQFIARIAALYKQAQAKDA